MKERKFLKGQHIADVQEVQVTVYRTSSSFWGYKVNGEATDPLEIYNGKVAICRKLN